MVSQGAESALTGRTARVQGRSIQNADVVLYFNDYGRTAVGEVHFFASIGSDLLVGVSPWRIIKNLGRYRKVVVRNNLSIIPFSRLLQAMIYTPTEVGSIATVIMPAL